MSLILGILDSGAAAGGGTAYESIATATGTGSSGSITFSSIPATYKHLQVRCNFFGTAYNTPVTTVRLNGDTGSNYAWHNMRGTGTSVVANSGASAVNMRLMPGSPDIDTNYGHVAIIDVIDYASTTKNKTMRAMAGTDGSSYFAAGLIGLGSGHWRNTNAVTSLTIFMDSGNFSTNSTFALYGIKG